MTIDHEEDQKLIPHTVVAWRDSVFAMTSTGQLAAFDVAKRRKLWEVPCVSPLLFFDTDLVSVNLSTLPSGSSYDAHRSYFQAQTVCVCASENDFLVMCPKDGHVIWRIDLSDIGLHLDASTLLVVQTTAILVCRSVKDGSDNRKHFLGTI